MNTKQTITSFKLSVTWSDGKTEGLASHLPEYLDEHLLYKEFQLVGNFLYH